MIPDLLVRIPIWRILRQMENMQARLFINVPHRLLGCVRRSLVHYHHQMPSPMMRQHLPKECDHFFRADALLVKFENQATQTIDSRYGRYPCPSASYLLARRLPTRSPSLAQKGGQGYIGLVLKIQQSLVFLHGFANLGGFRPHPLVTGRLVHFKVLALRLLISQPCFAQAPPDRIMRNRGYILLLDNSMQPTDRPQIGFKPKVRRWLKNDFPKRVFVKVFEKTRSATSRLAFQPAQTILIESTHPAEKCRP